MTPPSTGGSSVLTVGAFLFRSLLVLAAIYVAVQIGWQLGPVLSSVFPSKESSQLGQYLGIGFALASLKTFFDQLPKLWSWIKSGSGDGLYTFATFVLMAVVSTSVAVYESRINDVPQPPKQPQQPPPLVSGPLPILANAQSVLFVKVDEALRAPSLDEVSFIIPFFAEAEGCDSKSERFRKGSTLNGDTETFLSQIGEGLLACSTREKPVRVQIVGFASSSPFDGCGAQSNELNRLVANARASEVERILRTAFTGATGKTDTQRREIDIKRTEWESYEAMQREREFNDRKGSDYSSSRALLTRRVDLRIDPGDCRAFAPSRLLAPSETTAESAAPDHVAASYAH